MNNKRNKKDAEDFKKNSPYYANSTSKSSGKRSTTPTSVNKSQQVKGLITRLYDEPTKKRLAVTLKYYPHLDSTRAGTPSSEKTSRSTTPTSSQRQSRPQTAYSHTRPGSANSVASKRSHILRLSPIYRQRLGMLDPLVLHNLLDKVLIYLSLADLLCNFALVNRDAQKLIDLDLALFSLAMKKDRLLMFIEHMDMNKCAHIRQLKLYNCHVEHILEVCVHTKGCLEVLELHDCSLQALVDFKTIGIEFKRLQTLTFINTRYELTLEHSNMLLARLPKTLEFLHLLVGKVNIDFAVMPAYFPRMKTFHVGTVTNHQNINFDSLGLIRLGGIRVLLQNSNFGSLIASSDVLKTLELVFPTSLVGVNLPELYPFIQLKEFVLRNFVEYEETETHFETLSLTLENFRLFECKFLNFPNIHHLCDTLSALQVVKCEVDEEIPSWIYEFTRLDYFELNECALSVPDEQNAKFPNLVVKKMCTEVIELCESPYIRRLDLSENDFNTIPDSSFTKWTNVRELNISHNAQLELNKYAQMSKMKNLEKLTFVAPPGYTHVLASLPLGFDELENLTELNVQNVGLTHIPPSLLGCINIRKLTLDNNKISTLSAEFLSVKGLPRLRHLSLKNNQLVTIPPSICEKPLLSFVDLRGNIINSSYSADVMLNDVSVEEFCQQVSFELFPAIRHEFLPHVSCSLNALAIDYVLPLAYTICIGLFCRVKLNIAGKAIVKHYHAVVALENSLNMDMLRSIDVDSTNKTSIKNWITVKPQGSVVPELLQELQQTFESKQIESFSFTL